MPIVPAEHIGMFVMLVQSCPQLSTEVCPPLNELVLHEVLREDLRVKLVSPWTEMEIGWQVQSGWVRVLPEPFSCIDEGKIVHSSKIGDYAERSIVEMDSPW